MALAVASGLRAQQAQAPAAFVANAITHTQQTPVLAPLTQKDVDRFQFEHALDDVKFHWVSNPANQTKDEKLFMTQLAKDCHAMGLGFVPNVFVAAPRPAPTTLLSAEQVDFVSSTIDENIGPFIIYRADVYAALKRSERNAIGDHELLHLERLIDYNTHRKSGGFFKPERSIYEGQAEELDADKAAITLHHGQALMSGMEKVEVFDRADFLAQNAVFGNKPGETYESDELEESHKSDHPLWAERRAIDLQEIKDQNHHRPHLAGWLKLHN